MSILRILLSICTIQLILAGGVTRAQGQPVGKPEIPAAPPTSRPFNEASDGMEQSTDTQPPMDGAVEEVEVGGNPEEIAATEEVEETEGLILISNTRSAIITVISRDDILTLGYRSIEEVLRNTVGFGINQNGHWADTGIRGINGRTTYGDKIQFLLDGHDMGWRQFNRNFHNPSWVNIDEIDRIEVIRGPGSALWGANALNGVVNIITRPWENMNSGEIVLGTDHRMMDQNYFARAGTKLGPVSFYTSFSYYTRDSDSLLSPIKEFSDLGHAPVFVEGDREEGLTLNVKGKYKGFTLSFYKNRRDVGAPLSTFSIIGGKNSRFITDRHILGLEYEQMLMTGLDLSVTMTYDDLRFGDGTVYEANPGAATVSDPGTGGTGRYLRKMTAIDRRYNLKGQISWLPTLNIQGIFGAEVEFLDLIRWHYPEVWAVDNLEVPEFTNWHTGVFAQARYTPLSSIDLSAVVRFDYDEAYKSVVTPRAGVVFTLPAGFSLKGLFGMAFKAPSFHDLYYYRKNSFYGNPELKYEQGISGEGQLLYQKAMHQAAVDIKLTGFYTHISNLIDYQKELAGTPLGSADGFPVSQWPDIDKDYSQKNNLEYVTSAGVEAEAMVQLFKRITLRAFGTYRIPRAPKTTTDEAGNSTTTMERLEYSSEWTTGGSITVDIHRHLDITFRGLGVGDKIVAKQALNAAGFPTWTAADDPTLLAPAYFVGTLVLNAKNLYQDRVSLSLKFDNFTNSEYWDAGREVLYPRPKFQGMLWMSVKL